MTTSQLNVLTLSETWFKPDDPPAITDDAAPDGFKILNVVRHLKSSRHSLPFNHSSIGGGLAIIYRDDLSLSSHPLVEKLPSVSSFELQLVRIGCSNHATTIINIYRPPSSNIGLFFDELSNVLAEIIVDCNDHLLLCGDLNCASADGSTVYHRLTAVFSEFGLVQHVNEPTRGSRLLDVIAADAHVPIRNVRIIDSAGISDHCLITATVSIQLNSPTQVHTITSRDLSDFDCAKFEAIIRSSALFTAPSTDVNGFTDQLIDHVVSALDAVCPLRSRRRRLSSRRRQPLSSDAVIAKRERRRLERRWLKSGSSEDRTAHRNHCRKTNRIITESHRSHISNQLLNCTDFRQRWCVVRKLLHSAKDKFVGSLIDNDALCASFSSFFSTKIASLKSLIATHIPSLPPPPPDPVCHYPTLQLLEPVTTSEVFKILSSIPAKTSVLDFVPTSVLKSCSPLFSELIAHLAKLSFSRGIFPSKFKHASVSPILKKPNLDPSVPANYRPISNLNNISKIIERLFLTRLLPHITSSPNFNPMQSAYRRHHSTETSLIHLLDSVYHAADDGLATLLLSLDLSAAFDTIDHSILLKRLSTSFGVMGSAHNWLNSYLSERSNSVRVGSSSSSVLSSICGVPQGSVLGPVLFSIYISPIAHIASQFNVSQQQYADDTQLLLFLSPSNLDGSLLNLQQCLSSLKSWFFHNGLALNSDKTEAICLGTTHRRQSLSDLASIQVADASVTLSDHIKLLGVTLDNRLSFDKHVSNVCSISYFHIRALRHIRTCLDLESSKSIACAIVGSRLDYANSCLSGVSSYNIHRLQRVQNCLARVVMPTRPVIASHSLLAALHWLPIHQRVTFKLACLVYRGLHGTSPAYLSSLLHAYAPTRTLRSSSAHLLVEPRLRTSLASRGFRSAGPRIWNSLPNHIKLAPSLSSFRSKLKTHLFKSFVH